jgi:transposase
MKKRSNKVTCKPYDMHQQQLLPQSLDELIDEGHVVRVVNRILDSIPLEQLLSRYKGGGRSCYHPVMMLKILVFAYTQHLYTSRQIAKALRENIHFMWLSGGNKPNFRTIAAFRRDLVSQIKTIFATTVDLLQQDGYVSFEEYFLDGTKIQSAANKYTFVWKKSVDGYERKLQEKLNPLFERIDAENEAEDRLYGDRDLPERGQDSKITSEQLEAKAKEIAELLSKMPENKELEKDKKKIEKDFLPRLKRYEAQQELFGDRNSFSKTDTDATFMRMKEDPMLNGQLKPGYNVQIGTENQFILGYSIHQRPTDTLTMIPHLEELKKERGKLPARIVADAGYGSEENLAWLEREETEAYVKYNTFDKERRRKFRKNKFQVKNLPYDPERDVYTCPAGKDLVYSHDKERKTDNGYQIKTRVYECTDCTDCPMKEYCHRGNSNRRIEISPEGERLRGEAKARLMADKGIALRKRRCWEVESVFGHIKQCRGFRRFLMKGLEKVRVEWGLLAIAHNALKLTTGLKT